MTAKQQMTAGFIAVLIVGSVAVMPTGAGLQGSSRIMPHGAAAVQPLTSAELSQDQVRDLTYN